MDQERRNLVLKEIDKVRLFRLYRRDYTSTIFFFHLFVGLVQAFKVADNDGNGYIDSAEVKGKQKKNRSCSLKCSMKYRV